MLEPPRTGAYSKVPSTVRMRHAPDLSGRASDRDFEFRPTERDMHTLQLTITHTGSMSVHTVLHMQRIKIHLMKDGFACKFA